MDWQPMKLQKMPDDVRAQIQRENRQQLTELLTRYRKDDVLWFNGGTGSDITLEVIRKFQPGIVINNRGAMLSLRQFVPDHSPGAIASQCGDVPSL